MKIGQNFKSIADKIQHHNLFLYLMLMCLPCFIFILCAIVFILLLIEVGTTSVAIVAFFRFVSIKFQKLEGYFSDGTTHSTFL